ncbi:protein phosphatase 2C domain-containing protein [Microcoleus sp. LEGE 07076]|uniref:protein phosphatase 2C domain-containing protein n=1 Tax=Microcoleus sp. LEGE 07076 TaxID=915322 RepID=UPI001881463D|nr:protein phosphatase 2C domain-containing protein [Microcoleus sp. LEGE 07076]MBE9185642.1 protein phosphatase 2C domain-containing protein [Microcoleus sp. LEGE 07076]
MTEEVASLSMSIFEKMNLRCQDVFCITKGGNSSEECEDAYECSSLNSQSPWYCAVSDGATESSFSKEWASKLVKSFVSKPFDSPEEISDWLEPLQQDWSNWLSQKDLPWFAKRKAAQGSYATLLGLKIEQNTGDREFKWQSIAVGDSCLFVVHSESLLSCFPLGQSSDLNSTPDLVGTFPQDNNTLTKSVKVTMGNAQSETHFYLVTDALAGWIFKTLESEKNPWQILDNINTQKEFIGWLDDLRVSREIRNDDTTLIHLYLVG